MKVHVDQILQGGTTLIDWLIDWLIDDPLNVFFFNLISTLCEHTILYVVFKV